MNTKLFIRRTITALCLIMLHSCGNRSVSPLAPTSTTAISPSIVFTADRTSLKAGECTTLRWAVTGGFGVTLDGQPVDKVGQMEVCPAETQVYLLAVDVGTHIETRQVEISVGVAGPAPGPGPTEPAVPAYQAESWVSMGGPPGDLGYDIRYNFSDHNIWYVTDSGGGFFISTDRGLTWTASNEGILGADTTLRRNVFSATVDPHNPQTIWIGTQIVGHIYNSTDGGKTWVQKDNGISPYTGQHFRGFTVDPRTSDIVYAQAEVDCYVFEPGCTELIQGGRVYRTTDGGENWEIIWEGDALARYLWIDPTNPDVLYVSTGIFDRDPLNTPTDGRDPLQNSGVGVLKSTDGGRTWTELGKANGLTILHVGSLYMHPNDPQTLLAGAGHAGMVRDPDTNQDVMYGGVFLTTDGGQNWTQVVKNDLIGAVEFCEQNPSIAYAAGWLAAYRSEDGGHTWQKFGDETRRTWGPPGLWPGVPIDMQTDPEDCSRVFINNYVGGNFISTDGAETWSLASTGYSGAKLTDLWVDPQDSAHLYAAARMAPFVSRDGGVNWMGLSDSMLKTNLFTLVGDPSNPDHLLGTQQHPGQPATHFTSTDGGLTWVVSEQVFRVPEGLAEGGNNPATWYEMGFYEYAFAPSDPSIVYAATRNNPFPGWDCAIMAHHGLGIYRSDDGGKTWQPANDANTASDGFGALVVHPTDPQTVYAGSNCGKGIFKTTDGGRTWTAVNNGLPVPLLQIKTMAMDQDAPDTIFVGGFGGVFRTIDGGQSWVQLTAGLDAVGEITGIVLDPTNGQNIYVADSFQGVFFSSDGGNTFQPLRQGLDPTKGTLPVMSLAISGDGSVLYAGTANLGVWRLGTP